MTKIIVVAFKYDTQHSVAYRLCDTPQEVSDIVRRALEHYQADVISIRKVYEKCPIP